MNTLFVAVVSNYAKVGHETDKNGNQNFWLSPLAGKIANKAMVFNGTQAIKQGVEAGNTYLFSCTEGAVSEEYGRQFSVSKLKDASFDDIISAPTSLGEPQVIDCSNAEVVVEKLVGSEKEFNDA